MLSKLQTDKAKKIAELPADVEAVQHFSNVSMPLDVGTAKT